MPKLLEKVNFKHLFSFFLYFFLFCLLLHNSFGYLDPDFGWHLKAGQEIVRTGAVPSSNHYNYTFIGNWVDHEWLSNVLLYLVYDRWGYLAVTIIFALLVILSLVLLDLAAKRFWPKSYFLIIFLQIFGVLAISPHLGVRIQEVGLLFLSLLLLVIADYDRQRNWKVLLYLPFLMYLWACLHASFLIGFFLLVSWFIIKIGEKILIRFWQKSWLNLSKPLSSLEILIFTVISGLSFIATLFSPYGTNLYSFLKGYQNTFYLSRLQEWLSQFSFPFQYLQLLYLALVCLALIIYIYYSLAKEKHFKIDLWTLFLVILFVALSFESRRHFPLMFIATFCFLIEVYGTVLVAAPSNIGKRYLNSWLWIYLLVCLCLVSVFELVNTNFTADPFNYYCRAYPCAAATYLASHQELDSLYLLNDYGWGGYLIWRLPDRKLFIDGRLPQVGFAGHTFLEEYLEFFKKGETIKKKLDQYRIRLVLLPAKDEKISAQNWEKIFFGIKDEELDNKNYLRDYLINSSEWRQAYYDQTSVIYVR